MGTWREKDGERFEELRGLLEEVPEWDLRGE